MSGPPAPSAPAPLSVPRRPPSPAKLVSLASSPPLPIPTWGSPPTAYDLGERARGRAQEDRARGGGLDDDGRRRSSYGWGEVPLGTAVPQALFKIPQARSPPSKAPVSIHQLHNVRPRFPLLVEVHPSTLRLGASGRTRTSSWRDGFRRISLTLADAPSPCPRSSGSPSLSSSRNSRPIAPLTTVKVTLLVTFSTALQSPPLLHGRSLARNLPPPGRLPRLASLHPRLGRRPALSRRHLSPRRL